MAARAPTNQRQYGQSKSQGGKSKVRARSREQGFSRTVTRAYKDNFHAKFQKNLAVRLGFKFWGLSENLKTKP